MTQLVLGADPAVAPTSAAGRAVSPARKAVGRAARVALDALWPLALLLLAWWLWVRLANLPPAVAPDPTDVLAYIAHQPRSFAADAWHTIEVVVGGMVLGVVAGALLATVSWFSPAARAMISGPALLTQCLPVAVISPILARVFGYSTATIVIITALIAFFPVLVFTTSGLLAVPPGSSDLFTVLGARRWQRFIRLAAPAALPRTLVSLRLSIVAAVAGAMLAQWIMGTDGLGYRLIVAQSSYRTAEAWACSAVSIALSVLLYSLVASLCRLVSERFD
ncbi:ABC transporter permease subunit [Mycolicibacterium sp. CH28]|uniref:ABC transporter permease n=1 Tax=Mycolicibacterium sp. CH28 TaxID=2512237 RepID=UPI0010802177|nr:ABC transporter permease subunit [Mycolicibacterium sp. CH28]TGD85455.1 ABC transporter permease subunit [Mycolicibacterium sp. CH28]